MILFKTIALRSTRVEYSPRRIFRRWLSMKGDASGFLFGPELCAHAEHTTIRHDAGFSESLKGVVSPSTLKWEAHASRGKNSRESCAGRTRTTGIDHPSFLRPENPAHNNHSNKSSEPKTKLSTFDCWIAFIKAKVKTEETFKS